MTTWQAQARPVSAAQLRADVAAGDVTGYVLTRSVGVTERSWLPGTTHLATPGDGRGGYGAVEGTPLSRDLAATLDGAVPA